MMKITILFHKKNTNSPCVLQGLQLRSAFPKPTYLHFYDFRQNIVTVAFQLKLWHALCKVPYLVKGMIGIISKLSGFVILLGLCESYGGLKICCHVQTQTK